MSKTIEGHLLVGRLKPEEKECVRELTRNLVAPKNIMTMLKGRNPDSKTNMKQIYNARQRFKTDVRGELSELQHLLKCCETNKYFHKCRTIGDSTTIQDIFWAHPESIKLFNTFPTVLMMDSTYKTNKYKMPLFEIVSVTSTEESYNVGFAYIPNEKEDNFVWALETCKSLLITKETFPKVIVTDRDKSLMNVVAKVFPNSTALVCRVHVYKNVKAKLKALCNAKEQKIDQLLKTLKLQWNSIIDSTSEESYTTAVVEFRKVFENFPNFVKYVETTVLDPVKEKFVSAWTNSVMHIGNTTTNRVESQHGALKQYLTNCKGDLVKGWEAMNQMIPNQLTKIKTSFGQSTTAVEHYFKNHFLYNKLVYNISRQALHFIRGEEIRSRDCGRNRKKCGCVIKKTYGLPCACLIALKIEKKLPIRLDEIDDVVDGEVDCLQEFNVIQVDTKGAKKRGKSAECNSSTTRSPSYWEYMDERFPDSQASQSKSSKPKRKTAQIGNLSPNVLTCRSIKYMEYMPLFMHSYIEDIIDVKGDGHCGFRVAAECFNTSIKYMEYMPLFMH
ncbi:hypothetical protein TSUD_103950 [Trifolium subterraneum]|uniref:MULE transposase domain-containing protein n=1 Tax=Trifolium subterraneum TaxID=3900 RepID=A0A2Z6M544_TRISU|nr:hypothetical protein TSUD_103950 [Trifolium subterraneum]